MGEDDVGDGFIRQFELVERVQAYNPNTDEGLLNAAYVFGAKAHAPQKRANGEPYWGHPVAVAGILTELKLDDATIATALLHDTIEDCPGVTYATIADHFGEEIADLVDGVTKISKLKLSSKETEQAENLRKLLMAMSKDVRVLLVKLADRLHNMRTIQFLKPEKQERKARETMEIYAPLAGRMGIQSLRDELEDLSFQVLNPRARDSIIRRFGQLKRESGDVIPQILEDLQIVLAQESIEAEVSGREKRPYAIWRKMEEKGQEFSRLSDIYGFRLICRNESDCYRALGAVHRRWKTVPGRFKDYISTPKTNGYRSIHTTVSGRNAKRVEVQIRTREMHEVAETGVAAHWAYKDGQRGENRFTADPFAWLRQLTDDFRNAEKPDEFLEHVKLDMFQDQVFCFTPKGRVITLPRGATPIDFAYNIHTRIGDSCVGAKIDGRRAPLSTRLRNGQTVEIIRAEAQRPQPVWEEIAVTGRAKQAIRRALRAERREADVRIGRGIVQAAFERAQKSLTRKALALAAEKLNHDGPEDLLQAVGAAEVSAAQILTTLFGREGDYDAPLRPAAPGDSSRLAVTGVSRARKVKFGECCQPVPGDRIVGIAEKGKGVTVHAIDCPVLADYEETPEAWVDLRWDPETAWTQPHQTSLTVTFANQTGALARVCTVIAELNADIAHLELIERKPDFYRARIDLEVRDVKHVSQVVTMLNAQTMVHEAARLTPGAGAPASRPAPLPAGPVVRMAGGEEAGLADPAGARTPGPARGRAGAPAGGG
ncbi:MAG: RelA/SpoT family protein [Albimonas sp.]|uniref:RelA/SpoT family protein n=1 Tax=Albimonas sp. TaxID=1872425 RepID=UPI004056C8D0